MRNCELCGEPLDGRGNGTAEMYDPQRGDPEDRGRPFPLGPFDPMPEGASVICHTDCGLAKGMEVA